ncbi:MAG TPA: flippase [bacterium]|nr:flippase [bacterium]HOR57178.1 flippase [bacterium]HPL56037.1 flippase [bacterium]
MSLKRKIAYNTAAQIVGRAVNTVISIVAIGILTRYLGVAGFGNYTTVFAFVGLFSTFADFGFMLILLRELGAKKVSPEKVAGNVLSIRTIFALVVYALCFAVGWLLDYPLVVNLGIGIIALSMLWGTIQGTVVAVLQANLKADRAVLGDVASRLTTLGLIILFSRLQYGLLALLSAYPVGAFVGLVINTFYANQCVKLRFKFDKQYWRYLWQQSWPVGLASILAIVYFKIDSVMLSVMKTQVDIGIYGAPYKIYEVLLALPALFIGIIFPIMSGYLAQKKLEKFCGAMQKSFDFMMLLSVPLMVGAITLARPIINIVAGSEFIRTSTFSIAGYPMTAVSTLQVLAVTIILTYLTSIFNNMIIAAGKQRALLLPNLCFMLLNIVLNLLLIPRFSYIGAAVATIITELCVLLVNRHLLHNFIDFRLNGSASAKAIVGGIIMALAILPLRNTFIVLPMLVGSLVYFVVVVATKAVSKEMLREIIKGETKAS